MGIIMIASSCWPAMPVTGPSVAARQLTVLQPRDDLRSEYFYRIASLKQCRKS